MACAVAGNLPPPKLTVKWRMCHHEGAPPMPSQRFACKNTEQERVAVFRPKVSVSDAK